MIKWKNCIWHIVSLSTYLKLIVVKLSRRTRLRIEVHNFQIQNITRIVFRLVPLSDRPLFQEPINKICYNLKYSNIAVHPPRKCNEAFQYLRQCAKRQRTDCCEKYKCGDHYLDHLEIQLPMAGKVACIEDFLPTSIVMFQHHKTHQSSTWLL